MNAITPKEKVHLLLGNIRSVRQLKNYTQEYLAVKIGISPKTYRKLEHGAITLTLPYFLQIAEILDLEPMQLIEGHGIDSISLFH
ncbi:helix-turn-helix transcriptional regulator [Mucilaginibacter sp. CAU 1740]|uniref:helix-turn-helix domain-containing protein n=1 Tax=Mucilaginibacter sp. CAU 1740 TaxID=3140365 RepID=UPI00325B1D88